MLQLSRSSVLLALLLVSSQLVFSQTDFRKGYVITTTKDSLPGLINYREGVKAYKTCDYKKSINEDATIYSPLEIIGYGFSNNKYFESREIKIANLPPQTVFLEVVVKGLVSLYKFEDTYWLEKDDQKLYQLINEPTEAYIDGRRVLKYSNSHIATMNRLLFDCVELRNGIPKITLTERALTNLIERYNACKGAPAVVYKAKKPWIKPMIGVATGVNFSHMNIESKSGSYKALTGSYGGSKSVLAGISLDIFAPRISERISFHIDLLYLKSTYHHYSAFDNGFVAEKNHVTVSLQQLKIPIGFSYVFPEKKFTPYFSIGMSSTIHLDSKSMWIEDVESNNAVQTYKKGEVFIINKNQLGVWGGVGVFKSINSKLNAFAELRYEQTNGITKFSAYSPQNLTSGVTNFQIVVGVRLK